MVTVAGCGQRQTLMAGRFSILPCRPPHLTNPVTADLTIFVVDDDEAVRDSLKALLQAEGLTVETFGSGQAFLEAYEPSRSGCLVLVFRS